MPGVSWGGAPSLLVEHRHKGFPVLVDRSHHLWVSLPETDEQGLEDKTLPSWYILWMSRTKALNCSLVGETSSTCFNLLEMILLTSSSSGSISSTICCISSTETSSEGRLKCWQVMTTSRAMENSRSVTK